MPKNIGSERLSGFLDKDTFFTGEIKFNNTLRIDGTFKGKIASSSSLLIGETGDVNAEIETGTISINGRVKGTINAKNKVEIFSKGKVTGMIITPKLLIEEGAFFEGECKMKDSNATPELKRITPPLEEAKDEKNNEKKDKK
jgi:cytoskeletal protein CcmA (bactofilin family)